MNNISFCNYYEEDARGKLVQGNITLDISSYHYGYEYKTGYFKYGEWIDLKYGSAKVIKINSIDFDSHKINLYCEYFENEIHAHNEKCKEENKAVQLRKAFKVIKK
jgi:hypothetical protein